MTTKFVRQGGTVALAESRNRGSRCAASVAMAGESINQFIAERLAEVA